MSERTARLLGKRLFTGTFVASAAVLARLRPLQSGDLLWQLRTGEAALAHGPVHRDLFSFPFRGAPILDHERAFELLVAVVHRRGGFELLWWCNLALVVFAALAAARLARRMVEQIAPVVLATGVVLAAGAPRLELRAEAATFFAIAIAHALRRRADEAERGSSGRWRGLARRLSPIVVAAVAAPFHGLALLVALVPLAHLGEAVVAVVRGERAATRRRTLAIDAVVAIAVVGASELASPGLLANLRVSATGPTFMRHIIEWYSPLRYARQSGDVTTLAAIGVALLALAGLVAMAREGRARVADVLLLAALSLLGLRFVRLTALPLLGAMPWAIAGLAELARRAFAALRSRASLGAMGALFALSVAHLAAAAQLHDVVGFDWSRQPCAAVAWLRGHRPEAALFHAYNQGALLIYEGWPTRGVVIDPRAWTLYPEWYARRYYDALATPARFEAWADEAPFDTVLLPKNHAGTSALARHLSSAPRWAIAYADEQAVAFVRR